MKLTFDFDENEAVRDLDLGYDVSAILRECIDRAVRTAAEKHTRKIERMICERMDEILPDLAEQIQNINAADLLKQVMGGK